MNSTLAERRAANQARIEQVRRDLAKARRRARFVFLAVAIVMLAAAIIVWSSTNG